MPLGWLTEGLKLNLLVSTVLADSGPMPNNIYRVSGVVSASVATRVDLELRDSTNTITRQSVPIFVLAGGTISLPESAPFELAADERIRLVTAGAVAGQVAGSIFLS